MTAFEAILLVAGGIVAGAINAVAGGGSILTVPLLGLAGVPGLEANGTNRLGILSSSVSSTLSFNTNGVKVTAKSLALIIPPALIGSVVGAVGISSITDDGFDQIFGLLMLPLILLTIKSPKPKPEASTWHPALTIGIFFTIGIYAGAIQAGVGLVLLVALNRSGIDLVTANYVKVIFTLAATMIALPIFILNGDVRWVPGIVLAVGLGIGGWAGAKLAVTGGEQYIRKVMVVSAVGLAGRMIGLY